MLHLAASIKSSSCPGLVNPRLCPMEQTWSIFHCKRVLSKACKLLSNTQDTAWPSACLRFLMEFFRVWKIYHNTVNKTTAKSLLMGLWKLQDSEAECTWFYPLKLWGWQDPLCFVAQQHLLSTHLVRVWVLSIWVLRPPAKSLEWVWHPGHRRVTEWAGVWQINLILRC